MKAVLNEMFWFRKEEVDIKAIKKRHDRRLFEEKACARCEYREMRYDPLNCGECAAYKGRLLTFRERETASGTWVGLPRGDTANFEHYGIDLQTVTVKDKRTKKPMRRSLLERLEFKVELRPVQKKLADAYLGCAYQREHAGINEPYGQLEAPPRTGKTLLSLYIAIKMGLKTLIIANQDDLLENFVDDLRAYTNIQDIEAFDGKVYHGIAKTAEQIKKLDIALCTWQSLHTELGKQRLAAIKDHVSFIVVDEAHRASAKEFAKVINAFPCYARLGVTATPDRKDGMHILGKHILGPVVERGFVETMTPKWSLHLTGLTAQGRKASFWPAFISHIHDSKPRNDLIARYVERDLKRGRIIVMPVSRRKTALQWAQRIKRLGYTAEAFLGNSDRKALVDKARAGEIQFIVGIRSILSTGINIPLLDTIYEVEPIANDPNFYQEYSRVCTPLKGKPQPIIRMFVDDIGPSCGCFKVCYRRLCKMPPANKVTEVRAKEIMAGKRVNEAGSTMTARNLFKSSFRKK